MRAAKGVHVEVMTYDLSDLPPGTPVGPDCLLIVYRSGPSKGR